MEYNGKEVYIDPDLVNGWKSLLIVFDADEELVLGMSSYLMRTMNRKQAINETICFIRRQFIGSTIKVDGESVYFKTLFQP